MQFASALHTMETKTLGTLCRRDWIVNFIRGSQKKEAALAPTISIADGDKGGALAHWEKN